MALPIKSSVLSRALLTFEIVFIADISFRQSEPTNLWVIIKLGSRLYYLNPQYNLTGVAILENYIIRRPLAKIEVYTHIGGEKFSRKEIRP